MGLGLYDAAFGALGRIYGSDARGAITGITLIAGFASTVGWPLSSLGLETIGWRETCYAWAAAHIVIGLPLNLLLPGTERIVSSEGPRVKPHIAIDRTMVLLSFAFAAAWTVTSAMAAHLPRIVEAFGATPAQAVFAGMMIGPAQVAARVLEASTLSRFHPLFSHAPSPACTFDWRLRHRHLRRRGGGGVRPAARRRQWHPHHCARHATAGDLRPRKLRLSSRPHWCTLPHRAGARSARVRTIDRTDGTWRCGRIVAPELGSARCADAASRREGGSENRYSRGGLRPGSPSTRNLIERMHEARTGGMLMIVICG